MGPWVLFLVGAVIAGCSFVRLRSWLTAWEQGFREAERKAPSPVPLAGPVSKPEHPHRSLQSAQQEAAMLADAGLSVAEIARRLGLTKAEVQLMLDLRRSQ